LQYNPLLKVINAFLN